MQAKERGRLVAVAVVLITALAGCGHASRPAPSSTGAPDAVVVASFNFPESELLAEIYAQALEHAGVPVRREFDLGPRELVQPALRQGLVDVVPEYLGSALASIAPDTTLDWTDPRAVLAALRRDVAPWHLVVLQPAAASDQNGFAVTKSTAARLHLRTLSDLAAVAPRLTLGGPTECPQRPVLPGRTAAGIWRAGQGNSSHFDDETQRATALDEGVIDVAVTFTTDGQLATGRLVLLRDDRRLQPTEQVAPVVSSRALSRYGARLRECAGRGVGARSTRAASRFLNWRVGVAGKSIRAEAQGWLDRHAVLDAAR